MKLNILVVNLIALIEVINDPTTNSICTDKLSKMSTKSSNYKGLQAKKSYKLEKVYVNQDTMELIGFKKGLMPTF